MIVKNTPEIRKHLPVNINLSIENLKPFIGRSEIKYLIPLLGLEQYEEIKAYADSNTTNEDLEKLLNVCIPPIVFLSVYEGYDLLNVEFSDSGFHRNETEGKKGLYGYQERNIKGYLKNTGFNGLENVLKFLEENIDTYEKWADSEACSSAYDGLIRTASEFSKFYVQLRDSSIVFRQMKSAMQRAEDFQIRCKIGDTIVDTVKELIKDREIDQPTNNKYKLLLPYIQKPLAYLTVYEAANELGVKLTDKGMYFEEVNAGLIPDNISETSPDSKVEAIKTQTYAYGRRYLTLLANYLNDHAADFEEYTPISDDVVVADQSSKKTHTMY